MPGEDRFVFANPDSDARTAAMRQAIELVPESAPVSATNRLGAHLSARRRFYLFPERSRADWTVVDIRDADSHITYRFSSWLNRGRPAVHYLPWGVRALDRAARPGPPRLEPVAGRLAPSPKAGLLAGTFNPFARAHAALAVAGHRAGCDPVVLAMAPVSLAKEGLERAHPVDRLDWVRSWARRHPWAVVAVASHPLLVDMAEALARATGGEVARTFSEIEAAVLVDLKRLMASRGFYRGEASAAWDEATEKALDSFIASENFEERVDLKKRTIDAAVLAHLRGQA